jgi:hypothetical protein
MAVLVTLPVLSSATDLASLLLSVLLGLGLVGYGLFSQVRRRLLAGAATVLLSVALAVILPLAGLVRSWEGWALWLVIGAIGLGALAAAGVIERRRTHQAAGLSAQWRARTADWE